MCADDLAGSLTAAVHDLGCETRHAIEWFLGRNDLGLAFYDSDTSGCRDGLHVDRVSQNEGAESTLAFLLSLAEMQALHNSLTNFKEPSSK